MSKKQGTTANKPGATTDSDEFLNPHQKLDIKKAPQQLKSLSAALSDVGLEYIVTANEDMLDPSARPADKLKKAAEDFLQTINKILTVSLNMAQHYKVESTAEKLLVGELAYVTQQKPDGTLDPLSLEAASHQGFKLLNDVNIQSRVFSTSNAVRVLCIQELSAINEVQSNPKVHSGQLVLSTTSKALANSIIALFTLVETARYLSKNRHKYNSVSMPIKNLDLSKEEMADKNIWDEDEQSIQDDIKMGVDKGKPVIEMASFNNLIRRLTSEIGEVDPSFQKTFVTTYLSFTNPYVLFSKLIERYRVPPGRLQDDMLARVKLRTSIVLKYWIEHQFYDLDQDLVEKIYKFTSEELTTEFAKMVKMGEDGQSTMLSNPGTALGKVLDRKKAERREKTLAMFQQEVKLQELKLSSNKSFHDLFLNAPDEAIARQLTLIDFSLFSRIEPAGLLNQSWNKAHLQYRSTNVLAMIARTNKVSFWVASMILFQEKWKERKKIWKKFIGVAEHLKKLNNFHTLMGIIAGLNSSSITRLKTTVAGLSAKSTQAFSRLEQLMHPQGSFRNYREYLHSQSLPCLPYLGTYLSDLTFMEDGNPDTVISPTNGHTLINFGKRQMVYYVIAEIQQYQSCHYDIKEAEPLYTFLQELPSFTDKQLYTLSQQREPKETKATKTVGQD
eukprot:TRINITY_DN51_c6_g1_i2.p1 TRINITY_DN51_c6_g1~~TRINITY_DN51_c6_g1_i2.p1  ORF type:complete len:672 (-),score=126.98 TRINITY_DN51_c6_g1_i2:112-2127(-)